MAEHFHRTQICITCEWLKGNVVRCGVNMANDVREDAMFVLGFSREHDHPRGAEFAKILKYVKMAEAPLQPNETRRQV